MAEPFVGEVRYYGGATAPHGWALCNGHILKISEHTALFSLIGTKFGGNGSTEFALPDFRGRLPVGAGKSTAGPEYTIGEVGGQETLTVGHNSMPKHTHAYQLNDIVDATNTSTVVATTPAPHEFDGLGKVVEEGGAEVKQYAGPDANGDVALNGTILTAAASPTTGKTGGGKSQTNMMPYIAINMIIALTGVMPSRQ